MQLQRPSRPVLCALPQLLLDETLLRARLGLRLDAHHAAAPRLAHLVVSVEGVEGVSRLGQTERLRGAYRSLKFAFIDSTSLLNSSLSSFLMAVSASAVAVFWCTTAPRRALPLTMQ